MLNHARPKQENFLPVSTANNLIDRARPEQDVFQMSRPQKMGSTIFKCSIKVEVIEQIKGGESLGIPNIGRESLENVGPDFRDPLPKFLRPNFSMSRLP